MLNTIHLTDNKRVEKGIYTFINPFTYYQLRKHQFSLGGFNGVFIDGFLLCKVLSFLGITINRVSFDFTSLAGPAFAYATLHNHPIYIIGSTEENIGNAVGVFREMFPDLEIVGTHHGYLQEEDYPALFEQIQKSGAEMVIVGMGALRQEQFLLSLKDSGFNGLGFSCGGFLHQTADAEGEYYPEWIDKLHMRWIYRIYKEPKLAHRYLLIYPIATSLFIYDIVSKRVKITR